MKNIYITLSLVLGSVLGLLAQDCATGYCPAKIYTHHKAGAVSPVNADITYNVILSRITGTEKCWITQNLGASVQANSYNDVSDAAAGWTWQFGKARGYSFVNTTGTVDETTIGIRTPATHWIITSIVPEFWSEATDPCCLLLGGGWRLPTADEWGDADTNGKWKKPEDAYNDPSLLRLHNGGCNYFSSGVMWNRGRRGYFWSSTPNNTQKYEGQMLYMSSTTTIDCAILSADSDTGASVRCIKDL